jgi:hypothetical protein
MATEKVQRAGLYFKRIDKMGEVIKYPAWRYHPLYEPVIVNDEIEDGEAYEKGWRRPEIPKTALQAFNNFYHDLEDMSVRQLVKYAKDEYNADLPEEAGKAKLLWAIWKIASESPRNKSRMVLLAQSMKMDYDETQDKIRDMAEDLYACDEVIKEEIWL